ncbi:MAG: hypothetical protein ACI9HX_000302, partial [Pseudoalteromonas tetraodonis]
VLDAKAIEAWNSSVAIILALNPLKPIPYGANRNNKNDCQGGGCYKTNQWNDKRKVTFSSHFKCALGLEAADDRKFGAS